MSAIDGAIQKKIHGSGTTTLLISNEEMNDIMKIVQTLEDSNILLKGVTKTIKNETKELSLLGNLLTGKETVRAGYGSSVIKKSFNSTASFNKF